MSAFKEIAPTQLSENPFELIGKKWMLISAGTETGYNTMTASWGSFGVLWGMPISNCYIRPQRHTFEFMQREEYYSLSFFDEEYRNALNFCGKKSGRDYDKAKETGLTPVFDYKTTYFEQASLVVVCKKLYVEQFKPELFLSPEIEKNYPDKDYHHTFIGKIEHVLQK
jgi:flavin reductase (DIM6/NTAB) family NADH-FMN oxidoreductase RutF